MNQDLVEIRQQCADVVIFQNRHLCRFPCALCEDHERRSPIAIGIRREDGLAPDFLCTACAHRLNPVLTAVYEDLGVWTGWEWQDHRVTTDEFDDLLARLSTTLNQSLEQLNARRVAESV